MTELWARANNVWQTVKKQSEMLFVRGMECYEPFRRCVLIQCTGDSVVLIAPQEGVTQ